MTTELTFSKISLELLYDGIYNIEKHRLVIKEIKVGASLHNEFLNIFPQPLDKMAYENESFLLGAKLTLVLHKDNTYYMKPNEILFLSERDDIYVRAKKI